MKKQGICVLLYYLASIICLAFNMPVCHLWHCHIRQSGLVLWEQLTKKGRKLFSLGGLYEPFGTEPIFQGTGMITSETYIFICKLLLIQIASDADS